MVGMVESACSKLRSGGFECGGGAGGGTETLFVAAGCEITAKISNSGGFVGGDFSTVMVDYLSPVVALMLLHLAAEVMVSVPIWVSCTANVGGFPCTTNVSGTTNCSTESPLREVPSAKCEDSESSFTSLSNTGKRCRHSVLKQHGKTVVKVSQLVSG